VAIKGLRIENAIKQRKLAAVSLILTFGNLPQAAGLSPSGEAGFSLASARTLLSLNYNAYNVGLRAA
jgi:hypothetical protein